ncbi:MAG: hypothetical protein WB508_08405 [Aeromicrobium sp.]
MTIWANLGPESLPLPAATRVLASSGPLPVDATLPPDTTVWLAD